MDKNAALSKERSKPREYSKPGLVKHEPLKNVTACTAYYYYSYNYYYHTYYSYYYCL